jgi:hypothetical protein
MYWNSPVANLPVDYKSPQKIASLGQGNLGPSPEFLLNVGDNTTPSTPSSAMVWGQGNPGEFDSGNYPMNPTTLVSNYVFGNPESVSAGPLAGGDNHVLMLNSSTCIEYETYGLQNSTPPYSNSTGTIVDWKGYDLRKGKYNPASLPGGANDSDGLDNGTASGIPIWPMVLTHDEVFGAGGSAAKPTVSPIDHGVRFALTATQATVGFQWPATHTAGTPTGTANIFMGETFRLKNTFDTTTCHYKDYSGQTFPPWFQNVLADLQQYGLYYTDVSGSFGLVGTDASQAWGDPNLATSDNWIFAGWLHCIQASDLEIVDNTPRVISTTSGQVNQNFPAR